MRSVYYYWSSALSAETCDEIIEKSLQVEQEKGITFADENNADSEKRNIRNSSIRWVHTIPGMENHLWPFVNFANREAFNIEVRDIFEIQFTEYHGSDHQYYNWHIDVDFARDKAYDRKLSCIIQLTDPSEYEGGELQIAGAEIPENFKERGSVIVFPSYMEHRVTPVTKGTRYSLVSWIEGPRWK